MYEGEDKGGGRFNFLGFLPIYSKIALERTTEKTSRDLDGRLR